MTPALRDVLAPQRQALDLSVAAVTRRIEALEEYAELVRAAESAYTAQRLLGSNDKYRDLLAGTDDKESLQQLTAQAQQTETALRDSLAMAIHTGQTLALASAEHRLSSTA
jgi:hypothetical protein